MPNGGKKRILCVGLVCYDLVNVVDFYPKEDTQMRTVGQRRSRGGNASNMTTVLSRLGFACEFMGSLTNDKSSPDQKFVEDDFLRHGIVYDKCPRHDGHSLPNSCIILNQETGSRTILHNNDGLPELTIKDFFNFNPDDAYSWIHLEGRPNAKNLEEIAKYLKIKFPHIPISLELEKPERATKSELCLVLPYVDVLFVSKECAASSGALTMVDAVMQLFCEVGGSTPLPPNSCIICPWGDKGAAARDKDGNVIEIKSFPPASGTLHCDI